MSKSRRVSICAAFVLGAAALSFHTPASKPFAPALATTSGSPVDLFSRLPRVAFRLPTALGQSAATDRLVLIKSLYYFVNGGAAGTWPNGAEGELTGGNAPSDRLEGGFLGVVNSLMGPDGDISKFLEGKGYTSCGALPDTSTTFDVTTTREGKLKVTVGKSTRSIPAGLANTGTFEKRIAVKAAGSETNLAVVHLHCSGTKQTMLVRFDTDLETEGRVERVEAVMEGTQEGPDVNLHFITQDTATAGRDLAMHFKTTDGDAYAMYVAFTSGTDDANGNGPAHILAGVAGKRSAKAAKLHVMGANADLSAASVSNDVAGLPLDKTKTPDAMAAGNQFCIDVTTAGTTTGCPTLAAPAKPAVSGLAGWTLQDIYTVRQGTTNVGALTGY